ncbi:MAG TPA: RodZ domain-containing protein [Nocardioidaceae bacterium]|nr:RodZ domain-containing protein [Nocardioidaceae bacterium]
MPDDVSHQPDELQVTTPEGTDEAVVAATPVVVRRHAGVAALVGAAASAVAIAYMWRATQTMAVLDWTLFGAMSLIAALYLVSLVDSRTPLLVADDLGVRIRLGDEWRGLPWEAIGQVAVRPRRGLLRDGRLVFSPRSLARALEGLDARARRHVALNQKMYGAALAVPVGATTRVSTSGELSVADEIAALALGRVDVVELDPRTREIAGRPHTHGSNDPDQADAGKRDPRDAPDAEPGNAADSPTARDERAGGPAPAVEDSASAEGMRAEPSAERGPAAEPGSTQDRREVFPRIHDDEASAWGLLQGDAAPAPSTPGFDSEGNLPPSEQPVGNAARRSILGGIGTIVSRMAKSRTPDAEGDAGAASVAATAGPAEAGPAPDSGAPFPLAPAAALRDTRPGLRAEATLDVPPTAGNTALDPAEQSGIPEERELRRPGSVDLVFERVDDRVRPISTLGEPVAPLVIDDFVTEPAYDPVIGPELSAARTRLGLSVDELAERTRIRPHVIESIEVDDFAPCGGDFYARGHLRTLARILGKDVNPLLEKFEERYATAPINARRVFEAELATGMTGSMRSTVGGQNWGLLVGVVLSLVLVWGVVRLFTTEPVEMVEVPAPLLNGSAGVEEGYPGDLPAPANAGVVEPVTVRITASQADSEVVVRDGDGMVVFSGEMVLGERKTLRLTPPVRIRAADGGAVEVRVAGRDRGLLGEPGEPARRTFR